MTENKSTICGLFIVSICMTILMEIFQLYTLPVLGILELFMLVNVCMITVNLFIRKCVNHVETLIVTGCFSVSACAKYIYAFVFYWHSAFTIILIYSFLQVS